MTSILDTNEKLSISDKINTFIQKNRRFITGLIIAFFIVILVTSIIAIFYEALHKSVIAQTEDYAYKIEKLAAENDEEARKVKTIALITEILSYAKKSSGYAAARSWSMLGFLYSERNEWTEAETAWMKSASALPHSYLAPISLYQAAVALEEQGNNQKALEFYDRIVSEYSDSFSMIPRVLLAIGRINETTGDKTAAVVAYRKLLDGWPSSSWTKFANGRIIILSETK